MPPRMRLSVRAALQPSKPTAAAAAGITPQYICLSCRHASLATTPVLADPMNAGPPAIARHPLNQPPSHKRPEFRKSQLHRHYQSMLRSSPLMLVFQHNNLKANEWTGIRRELATALRKVDEELANNATELQAAPVGAGMKLQIVQTGILASAMRIVEFWDPKSDSTTSTSTSTVTGLSRKAYHAANRNRALQHGLEPLLTGPLALLTFPTVSPAHLSAALKILAPSKTFPAPKRKANPAYHEPAVQSGLSKLMLLAARVEGKVFDAEGTKWVGGIVGGVDGLRAQLVAMLGGVAGGVTSTLEAAGRSLYVTLESRRGVLEEEEGKGGGEEGKKEEE